MHELQELDGELDVAQPAGAQLELALGLMRRDVVEDPASHRLHVLDEPVAVGRPPHERCDPLEVLAGQCEVAGDGPGLEQGLELPRLAQRA